MCVNTEHKAHFRGSTIANKVKNWRTILPRAAQIEVSRWKMFQLEEKVCTYPEALSVEDKEVELLVSSDCQHTQTRMVGEHRSQLICCLRPINIDCKNNLVVKFAWPNNVRWNWCFPHPKLFPLPLLRLCQMCSLRAHWLSEAVDLSGSFMATLQEGFPAHPPGWEWKSV